MKNINKKLICIIVLLTTLDCICQNTDKQILKTKADLYNYREMFLEISVYPSGVIELSDSSKNLIYVINDKRNKRIKYDELKEFQNLNTITITSNNTKNRINFNFYQLFGLPSIREIHLWHSDAINLDSVFKYAQLDKLNQLTLYDVGLVEMPCKIFECENIKEIDLSVNNIQVLNKNINNLKKLEVVKLSNNKLEQFDFPIKLPELKCIDLSLNLNLFENRSFYSVFQYSKKIEEIYLAEVGLKEIDSLNMFPDLKIIDLEKNGLNTIISSINELKALMWINVSDNMISNEELKQLRTCYVLMPSSIIFGL